MLKKKNSWSLFVPLIILIFALAFISGCAQKEREEVVKVGVIAPLSGNLAGPIGIPHQRGLILGLEDAKDKGINIDLIFEDDKGDKKEAVTIANQFLSLDKDIKILISPLSGVSFALAPICKENNIILFSTGANPKIPQLNNNAFRFFISADQEAIVMSEFAKNNLNLTSIAILYQNDEFGISEKDAIKREFEKRGIKVVAEEAYELGASDVKSQVTKIIAEKPSAIVFTGFGSGLVTAIKTVREFDPNMTLFSDLNAAYPPLSTELINLTEGMYITDFKFERDDLQVNEFIENFKNKFGDMRVYPNSALEYGVVQIIGEIVKRCGDDVVCMKNELLFTEFNTLLGNITFNEYGDATAPVVLKQIVNGEEKIVYK